MNNQGWIWIAVLFGIGIGLWLLVTPKNSFRKKTQAPRQPFSNLRTCTTDPPPDCELLRGGGWGKCKDSQGSCALRRGCGYTLKCYSPFACKDALGSCIWY